MMTYDYVFAVVVTSALLLSITSTYLLGDLRRQRRPRRPAAQR